MAANYREGYSLYACNGILFNHESPRRGETFVIRKITMALTHIVVDAHMEAVGLEPMGKDKMLPDPQSSINLAWARSVRESRC